MKVSEEKILEVAYTLFKKRGVRTTSLQQVAKACGTTLFDTSLIFKSKKELVVEVVKHRVTKKTGYLLISSSLSPSAVSELHNFFKFIDESISDFGHDMFTEIRRYDPKALDQIRELVDEKLTPCLRRNIERGLSEGFYRDNLNSEHYASTYFYLLRTILESGQNWMETKKTIAHINDIYLHGVLNVKGMRI